MSAVESIDAELTELLRARGQRVTSQRLVINRMLRSRDQHVTAEEVLGAVTQTLPGTSLPTVYATLELFEQLGIVRRLNSGGGAVLFDSRTVDHHHAICRDCGAVQDIDDPAELSGVLQAARDAGFAPDRAAVVVDGLCAACAAAS
ncbi:Fur family transcriptional regulator [Conexibacter sp. JD483]|uniref:Fur family transcriptional regulator n=1 Tax=unclassified Conexibacter TaxID=2627773 RepID=UPI002719C129|nr:MULTISPECIES: Fur family transcriptional regulator [unclassified Conexibacter]MDO8185328.1 Fur family transcriptional regulator [Conexibacter sp. CPCC 205706]MDO8198496.1 Fur family transcriptional regulator [Conexibacter sp. CPCC 205762]MDR9368739.1 Fur family transcriptional regulator [Conexibacter sp. JD483]